MSFDAGERFIAGSLSDTCRFTSFAISMASAILLRSDSIWKLGIGEVSSRVKSSSGHSRGKNAVDILWDREGVQYKFSSPRLPGKGKHGTGCHLSAAILANLALGRTLPESCQIAKDYLTELLQSGEGRLARDF